MGRIQSAYKTLGPRSCHWCGKPTLRALCNGVKVFSSRNRSGRKILPLCSRDFIHLVVRDTSTPRGTGMSSRWVHRMLFFVRALCGLGRCLGRLSFGFFRRWKDSFRAEQARSPLGSRIGVQFLLGDSCWACIGVLSIASEMCIIKNWLRRPGRGV